MSAYSRQIITSKLKIFNKEKGLLSGELTRNGIDIAGVRIQLSACLLRRILGTYLQDEEKGD